jgi:16S rRNA (uracil1498-N3)-methyltransferase
MSKQLFYIPDFSDARGVLPSEEAYHCYKVLRLKKGDGIQLTNGKGSFFDAEIEFIDSRNVHFKVLKESKNSGKKNYKIHIAIAPTKNMDRFEWFVEKACEIGIDRITPIITDHSERRVIKYERVKSIAISAIKQSVKAYLPVIDPLIGFKEFIKTCNETNTAEKFIAHCNSPIDQHLFSACKQQSPVIVLIGPEGDFSKPEVELALSNGFKEISLGTSRLRTETAGIVACHTIQLLNAFSQ